MSADDDTKQTEFEHHTHRLLEDSVTRVDARVRSRLNQARHAVLEEIAVRRRSFWRSPLIMPAGGAVAAAALVAIMLTAHRPGEHPLPGEQSAYEDIELLADNEGLDLIEGWDEGSFYEWAAAQSEDGDGTSG